MTNRLVNLQIVEDGVAVVLMDAPPLNLQSSEFCRQFCETFDDINRMEEIRSVVLTGAGKAFSAGADVREYGRGSKTTGERATQFRLRREAYFSVIDCDKPVIAAINGPSIGAGLGLAVCCDILVASESTVVGFPEIDVGLIGGARHAMRAFPYSLVRRMILCGDLITGEELYRRGIVEACLPQDQLMPFALDMARKLAAKGPVAMRRTKKAIGIVEQLEFKEGFRFEQDVNADFIDHSESLEALDAFLDKRKPMFRSD